MYRVNLYRERAAGSARSRRRLAAFAVGGVIIGFEAILIGFLVVSGFLLRDRIPPLEASVNGPSISAEAAPPEEARLARAVVKLRGRRLDWSPCLDAISRCIPETLVLSSIRAGDRLDRNQTPGIDLEGRLGDGGDLGPVLAFVEALRADPVISATFPHVYLEKSDSDRTRSFTVICRVEEERDS